MTSDDYFDCQPASRDVPVHEEFVVGAMTELLRMLLRGIASQNKFEGAYQACQQLGYIRHLRSLCENFREGHALIATVSEVSDWDRSTPEKEELVNLALLGMRYLIESSAKDNFAGGRAAQREADFRAAAASICHDATRG